MEQPKLIELLTAKDWQKTKDAIMRSVPARETEKFLKQYNPANHDIFDTVKRPDKKIENEDGTLSIEKVNRIGLPMQKLIAQVESAFMCANPVRMDATPKEGAEQRLYDALTRIDENNKLAFRNMDIAEKWASETEAAELWFTQKLGNEDDYWAGVEMKGVDVKFRMMVLAPSKGDGLYPIFDRTGNMIAFARTYATQEDEKTVQHVDLYTDTTNYFASKAEGKEWDVKSENNLLGKIPVVYYSREQPAWADVQTAIDRLELQLSNHAETNDYFAAPMLFIKGRLISISRKADNGKVLESDNQADAKYLTWNEAPESTKLEIDNLIRFIYACTSTPDISFDNLKGMGTTSGFALEMMFMGAHLKAARNAGVFGEGLQRRYNFLKAAVIKVEPSLKAAAALAIKPVFDFFMPKNTQEAIEMLTLAVTGGIMSKETAVKLNPLVEDADAEKDRIDAERNSASALDDQQNAA